MGSREHEMALAIDELSFALGIGPPKHEDDMLTLIIESGNSRIGEFLPPFILMAAGTMCLHGKGSIQQQYPLLGPALQIAAHRDREAEVAIEFLIYILQRGRYFHTIIDRETKSVRLSYIVVGVLTDNNNSYPIKRARVKGIEDETGWRKALARLILRAHELSEQFKVRFIKLRLQHLSP